MQIFHGEKDIDYHYKNKYAFLNWHFDDSLGSNNKDNPVQSINDNFELGKAYMAEAILTLFAIINSGNSLYIADILIFPVLFNIWHGIELWLKSSIHAIYLMTNGEKELKSNHEIYCYMNILKDKLCKIGMKRTVKIALTEVELLIEEFKCVGAHFDFVRYSFDKRGEYQFYNAPYGDNKQWQKNTPFIDAQRVPNTCVDLCALFEVLLGIAENFRDLVEYLCLVLNDGGDLTDEAYENHLKICKNFEKKLDNIDNEINDEIDSLDKIMKWIYLNIL